MRCASMPQRPGLAALCRGCARQLAAALRRECLESRAPINAAALGIEDYYAAATRQRPARTNAPRPASYKPADARQPSWRRSLRKGEEQRRLMSAAIY